MCVCTFSGVNISLIFLNGAIRKGLSLKKHFLFVALQELPPTSTTTTTALLLALLLVLYNYYYMTTSYHNFLLTLFLGRHHTYCM